MNELKLYGMIHHDQLSSLVDRLTGLCGEEPSPFMDHTILFIPRGIAHNRMQSKQGIQDEQSIVVETPPGPSRKDDIVLTLYSKVISSRHSDTQADHNSMDTDTLSSSIIPFSRRSWSLIQRSPPEPPKQNGPKLANHTLFHQDDVSGDVFSFLALLGYTFSSEFVRRGFMVRFGTELKVFLYRLYKLEERHKIQTAKPWKETRDWMVELVSEDVSPERVTRTSQDMYQFASFLSGIVVLDRVDHTKLAQKIRYTHS